MKNLRERPVLLAGIIFAVVLVTLVLWIVISDSGLDPGVYNP